VIEGVLFPLTIPGPDQTTEVLVLTGVTTAKAVDVLQVREVEAVDAILILFVFAVITDDPKDVHPLDVLAAV